MSKKAACHCKKSGECEECPEWIFTFADLVMLMMGFFVILWVLKPSPAAQVGNGDPGTPAAQAQDDHWVDTVSHIREAFGYTPKDSSTDPVDVHMRAMHQNSNPAGPKDKGSSTVRPTSPVGPDADSSVIRPSKQVAVGGRLAFDRGAAGLTADLNARIDQVADQVKGHRNLVLVQGHTALDDLDDAATPTQRLDLSLRRAEAVADRLVADGVSPDVLRVVGCSTYEPVVAGRYTPQAQADNRRVEVQVTSTPITDVQATRR